MCDLVDMTPVHFLDWSNILYCLDSIPHFLPWLGAKFQSTVQLHKRLIVVAIKLCAFTCVKHTLYDENRNIFSMNFTVELEIIHAKPEVLTDSLEDKKILVA